MAQIIASGRVYLRPFEATDAETYRRWRADAEPMALAGWHDPAPLSLAQVEKRIADLADRQGKDGYTFLICLVEGERPIGEVLLMDISSLSEERYRFASTLCSVRSYCQGRSGTDESLYREQFSAGSWSPGRGGFSSLFRPTRNANGPAIGGFLMPALRTAVSMP